MGNQSCSQDQLVVSTIIPNHLIQHSPKKDFFESQFIRDNRTRYGDLICKKKQGTNLNEYKMTVYHTDTIYQMIQVPERIFEGIQILQHLRKKIIKIYDIIKDENRVEERLYLSEDGFCYSVGSFDHYDNDCFKNILYKVFIMRLISNKLFRSKYIQNIVESFVMQSGQNRAERDKCYVIVMDEVTLNLSEIIQYRKLHNQIWTESEFEILILHCILGLDALHTNLISHNDIRPSNIYYSLKKHCYLIGGLSFAKKHDQMKNSDNEINGIPYFKSPQVRLQLSRKLQHTIYNQFKNDIYSLGITLLTILYLQMIKPEIILKKTNVPTFQRSIKIIGLMLQKQSFRPSAKQLLGLVLEWNVDVSAKQISLEEKIPERIHIRNRMKSLESIELKYQLSLFYENLFMKQTALFYQIQLLHYYELSHNKIWIAYFSQKIGNYGPQKDQQYIHRAYQMYKQIAQDYCKQRKFTESIFYFQKAINLIQQPNISEKVIIIKSLAKIHKLKMQFPFAQTFLEQAENLTLQNYNELSSQYLDILMQITLNKLQLKNLVAAQNYIKKCIKLLQSPDSNEWKKVQIQRVKILELLAACLRVKGRQQRKKTKQYWEQIEKCLSQAITISNNSSIHKFEIAKIYQNLGHLYLSQSPLYDPFRARKQFQKALLITKDCVQDINNKVHLGMLMIYIGDCQRALKQNSFALQKYNQAIQMFRVALGNIRNEFIALALSKLLLVYDQNEHPIEYKQYYNLYKQIMKQIGNIQWNDSLYFESLD